MAELSPSEISPRLWITADHRQRMLAIAMAAAPLEACGILAGDGKQSRQVIEITNILASPTRYRMSPGELVAAFWQLDSEGLSVLAFFHSHPASAPHPSSTDLDEHHYPEIPQIILGKTENRWELRAFLLQDQRIREIPIQYY